jgi:ferredoxin
VSHSRDVLPGEKTSGRSAEVSTVGRPSAGWLLRVDPLACDGIGICSHLAPSLISVDSWGYPILPRDALSQRELRQAQAAVTACPRRALFLQPPPQR